METIGLVAPSTAPNEPKHIRFAWGWPMQEPAH
jgi:hypothetical protein